MNHIQDIKLKATKANLISKAGKVFTDWIDPRFENWELSKDTPAEAQTLSVYETDKDGTYRDIFTSLSTDLDSLVLTQGQIIKFVKNHSELLNKDWANLFLFKVGDEFFVAYVFRGVDGWYVPADRFSRDNVWDADYRLRVVVPQLKSRPQESSLTLSPSDTLKKAIEDVKSAGYVVYKIM